jgi:hypothetical protein
MGGTLERVFRDGLNEGSATVTHRGGARKHC